MGNTRSLGGGKIKQHNTFHNNQRSLFFLFQEHHLCLATVLRYSPRSMQRLQALLQGRDAYMVGGVPHLDDLAVADELQVPFLGSEPAVAQLYSTKSGSKRIFASAGVPTPPGEWDIRSREQVSCWDQPLADNCAIGGVKPAVSWLRSDFYQALWHA